MKNGVPRIQAVFEALKSEGRTALMPYFPLGYPDATRSLAIIEAIAANGADILELGVPFSDPLADGPTIAHASQVALEAGISVPGCLELVGRLREKGVSTPIILMGYVNPILAYGLEAFVADADRAGADGFIVPDLPPEEAAELEGLCERYDLALIYLIAPTTPAARLKTLTGKSRGFNYLVSLTGVTGARSQLPDGLAGFIDRAAEVSALPVAVGFGISTPEQARFVGEHADGVIVGSALVDAVRRAQFSPQAGGDFVRDLRQGMDARVGAHG